MNIENNTVPGGFSQPLNQTYVQTAKSRPVGMIVMGILLTLLIFAFGGYVYYKEVYVSNDTKSPTNTPDTFSPTSLPNPTRTSEEAYDEYTLDLSTKLDEFENIVDEWVITKPINAKVSKDAKQGGYMIEHNNFKFYIGSEYEDEGYQGTSYKSNYKLISGPLYGDFYRVQSNPSIEEYGVSTYTYVYADDFKTEGTCEGFYTTVDAPCGDGMLSFPNTEKDGEIIGLFDIRCTAESDLGLIECDKIVASLRKI